jgi:hypothetical protein
VSGRLIPGNCEAVNSIAFWTMQDSGTLACFDLVRNCRLTPLAALTRYAAHIIATSSSVLSTLRRGLAVILRAIS